jgi:hypothetical protein
MHAPGCWIHTYIHTYHSRLIPEGVAEASQIFLRDAHVLQKLYSLPKHGRDRGAIEFLTHVIVPNRSLSVRNKTNRTNRSNLVYIWFKYKIVSGALSDAVKRKLIYYALVGVH